MRNRGIEFEALVGSDGTLRPFGEVQNTLQAMAGRRVRIGLEVHRLPLRLQASGEEQEIERIAALQMETRGQVMRLLLSEGKLRGNRRFAAALRREAGR